jgi:hypothetical protein
MKLHLLTAGGGKTMKTNRYRLPLVSTAVFLLFLCPIASGQEEEQSAIDPRAAGILREMGDFLPGVKTFGLKATETYDVVPDSGPRIQYSNTRAFVVRRPNRLAGKVQGDMVDRAVWYNGKTLSLLDKKHNVYGTLAVPDTIDATIDFLAEKYELVFPLADLFYTDADEGLLQRARWGAYAGLHHAAGVPCHHLVFSQELIDWQIWIEAGEKPLPRKVVIVYKAEPGHPQYSFTIHEWNLSPKIPKKLFRFQPPPGARKMPLLTIKPLPPRQKKGGKESDGKGEKKNPETESSRSK